VVGPDRAGHEVTALLSAEAPCEPCLITEPDRTTTVKTRFVADAHQLLRADRESTVPVTAETEARLLSAVSRWLDDCALVVLSDYGKGVLTDGVVGAVIDRARAAGKPVIVDPKGQDFGRYRRADVITPNRGELAQATRLPAGSDAEVAAAARLLIDRHGFGAVLVTRSEDGMTLVTADGLVRQFGARAREVFDVSGAGDTAVAVLAAGLAAGASLPAAVHLANLAGGIVVGKVGTAVVRPDELLRVALNRTDLDEAKIVTLAQALERVAQWRRAGLKVGFTNGCFDLLHPGHVSLLAQARAACDRLIVGINTDASVRRLKGPERPVQHELARAAVLASLAAVDLVVPFGEDTPVTLIQTIRPDLLVKGADYTVETVVGADLVQGYGGQVLLADLKPEHSTTGLVNRLRRPGSA
jgi:D-beta-D-heptose 7-phosphate kinase/D-beta-D-heptose 1-phosphate adenosyltransferase